MVAFGCNRADQPAITKPGQFPGIDKFNRAQLRLRLLQMAGLGNLCGRKSIWGRGITDERPGSHAQLPSRQARSRCVCTVASVGDVT